MSIDQSPIERRPRGIRQALAQGKMTLDRALEICTEENHPSSYILAGELFLAKARRQADPGLIDSARDSFVQGKNLSEEHNQFAQVAFAAVHVAQTENYRSIFCEDRLPTPEVAKAAFEATIAESSKVADLLPDDAQLDSVGHGMLMKTSVLALAQRCLMDKSGFAILASGYAAWGTGHSRPYDIALLGEATQPPHKLKVISSSKNMPSWGKDFDRSSIVVPARDWLRLGPEERFTSKTIIRECAQELSSPEPFATRTATQNLNERSKSFVHNIGRRLIQ